MNNEQLYETAKNAIMDLFNDTSVSAQQAIENLTALQDEIEVLIEGLQASAS